MEAVLNSSHHTDNAGTTSNDVALAPTKDGIVQIRLRQGIKSK